MNYEQAIKELQDNLIVLADVERRHSATVRHDFKADSDLLEFRRRTEWNLAEITEKLSRLTGKLPADQRPLQ
jgi:hypothetical protein